MRISRRIVLALTVVCAMAAFAGAQVLEQVPSGAWVVVKVKNLSETSGKLAGFFKELGVDQMVPELADPLGALKKELKIDKGIDEKGELAFVFINPELTGGDEEQSLLLLIPVSDYKAFTSNFADAKTDGDITEVQLPQEPRPNYLSSWGKYAALSPSKELLGRKPEGGIKLAGLTAKELAGQDAIVYVNLVEIRKKALPELAKVKTEAVEGIAAEIPENMKKYAPVLKAAVTQAIGAVERYLQDANSATYGISFVETGIKGTLMTEFEPGTYCGDNTKKIKNVNDSMLAGLPSGKYLSYGGMTASPDVTAKVYDDFMGPIMKEITGMGEDGKMLKDYADAVRKAILAANSASFGMVAPQGNLGQEAIFQTVQVSTGDAKAMREAQVALMKNQQELMKLLQGEGLSPTVTFTPNAKTVEGVSLDQMLTEFKGEAGDPRAAQMQQTMQFMYGAGGANVLTGQVDDKTLIGASGVSDQVIAELIKAAKTKDEALAKSEPVQVTASQLPKEKFFVMYVAADNFVTTGLKYMAAFGMQIPVNLPPNQPPIGITAASEGTAIRVDTFVPTQLVKSITAAIIQAQMQMQGGGNMGGGM